MENSDRILIRRLAGEEIPAALALAWNVFLEYEAPDYSPEGTEQFRKALHDETYLAGIVHYGAFDGEKLVGELSFRPDRKHICFFFIDGAYHRRGIGTKLFRHVLKDCPGDTVTVNSSPYGLPFYHKLGFRDTDKEQTENGIRYTPMEYSEE